jgi:hypothetical protein
MPEVRIRIHHPPRQDVSLAGLEYTGAVSAMRDNANVSEVSHPFPADLACLFHRDLCFPGLSYGFIASLFVVMITGLIPMVAFTFIAIACGMKLKEWPGTGSKDRKTN